MFPASRNPDKLIGSKNPGHDGGLVGRHILLISEGDERMQSLLVGIDVSKDFFSAAGIDSGGKEFFTGSYSMDSKGFEELLKTIRSDCEDLSRVVVAMESTGCYHINLFSFLSSQGIHTVVVNPLLIANFAKLSLRKTKTDKKDAMTITRFLLDHQEEISPLSISRDLQDLRDLSEKENPCLILYPPPRWRSRGFYERPFLNWRRSGISIRG